MKTISANLAMAMLAAMLASAGCEMMHYEYRAPATDQGRRCVTQCASIKEMCRANEMQVAQQNKDSCERTNDIKYKACLSRAQNKDQVHDCDKERKESSCWAMDTTYRCDEEYRSCFVNCGGTIIETKQ